MINPVVLFVPVSSSVGVGEYTRSVIIADALHKRLPQATIHFILNRNMKSAANCAYNTHFSDYSATKDTPLVKSVISKIKPDIVIFDCAGRAQQFVYAKRMGAKVIFISQHRKKRARGLSLRRLLFCDMQWVVQPEFAIKPLSWLERLKLSLSGKAPPKNIGPILPEVVNSTEVLNKFELESGNYLLFSAGSGGHEIAGELASDLLFEAAKEVQFKTKLRTLMVFGPHYPNEVPEIDEVLALSHVSTKEFLVLLSHARGRVLSAGSTLLQAIEMHKPAVAVAVSKDQPDRLNRCAAHGLVLKAEINSKSVCEQTLLLLEPEMSQRLVDEMARLKPTKGVSEALSDIQTLLAR
ncbi:MAG: hypothetical protein KUG78_19735 [Kangiellaceae bacterium]|nr:hypothetical protein [Kangiellaceae bacterium]